MYRQLFFLAFLTLALTGCGGGGTSTRGSQPGGQGTFTAGRLTATYDKNGANLKPVANAQGAAVITGLAGANFTKIIVAATNNLSSTEIAFGSKGAVYLTHPDGTGLHTITLNSGNAAPEVPNWNPSGTLLAFLDKIPGNTNFQIFKCFENGAGVTPLTNVSFNIPAIAMSSTIIAYASSQTGKSQVYTMHQDGSSVLHVSDGAFNDYSPQFSVDGQTIYFVRNDTGTTYSMYKMSASGANPSKLFSPVSKGIFSVSPDGQSFAYQSGFATGIIVMPPNGQSYAATTPPNGSIDSSPSFSPDGKQLAFERNTGSNGTLMVQNLDGSGLQALTDSLRNVNSVGWGPFLGARTVVGSGGSMAGTASGFLVGQLNTNVASVVTFACTTPGSATITQENLNSGSTNAVFQVTGDSIIALKYVNDLFGPVTAIVPGSGGTSAKGALFSFDAATGQVTLVVPFLTAKRAPSKNGVLAYSGRFVGIWNGHGKKPSAEGVSRIEIDAHSGLLIK